MNKKVITAAVASALAVPAAVNAQETTVQTYGRINNAIQYTDKNNSSNVWGLRNVVSRLGFKAKSDLGNGLSAIGRYEFFTYTNQEGQTSGATASGGDNGKGRGGINDTRLGYVGLSGAWGAVTVGNQWSSFYDTIGSILDPTYTVGYFLYSSVMGGPYRTSNTIKYANTFGPAYIEFDVRMSQNDLTGANTVPTTGQGANADEEVLGRDSGGNDDAIDGVGIGLNWNIGDSFLLSGAFDSDQKNGRIAPLDDTNTRWGLGGKFTMNNWWASISYYEFDDGQKDKLLQLWGGGTFGKTSVMLGYGVADLGGPGDTGDPNSWILGAYHNMGGGFRLYYEGVLLDGKNTGSFDAVDDKGGVHLFGMRYDFST